MMLNVGKNKYIALLVDGWRFPIAVIVIAFFQMAFDNGWLKNSMERSTN